MNKNILIGCAGSVAAMKLPKLLMQLLVTDSSLKIKVIVTEPAKHFYDSEAVPADIPVLSDDDEWKQWRCRGDPVLHIDLGKWADILIIAPLDANSLAKISTGICDNLLMCTVRAWDFSKPLLFCPAMNTRMYDHPLTAEQVQKLKSWGYEEVPPVTKTLICGDTGNGAMAEVHTIVDRIMEKLS